MGSNDISKIRSLVSRARIRLRGQAALEGAMTATVLASAFALATVFCVRAYLVTPSTGMILLASSLGIVIAGAVLASLRKLDDEDIARRIDRASNLSDRLSTAVAFERVLRTNAPLPKEDGAPSLNEDETRDLMRMAIADANRAAPRADVARATPFTAPHDTRAAAVFAGLAILAAGLGLPTREATVKQADPLRAPRGALVLIEGTWLCGPDHDVSDECTNDRQRVVLGAGTVDLQAPIEQWLGGVVGIHIPLDAPIGETTLEVWAGPHRRIGSVPFEVIDLEEEKKKDPNAITWEDDDLSYTKDLLEELKQVAMRDQVPELLDYVKRVEQLLEMGEKGELTKEELLEELQKAEEQLSQGEEPDQKELDKDISDMGKEMQKNEMTEELGKALAKNDLEKAKEEIEKLAEKLENGDLDKKEKEELAKALEKAAKEMQKKNEQRDKQQQDKIDKAEKEVRKLEKEKDDAKDEKQKENAERRLEKKKRELEELKKDKEKKEKSEQRRALKRLEKDMDDAAKDLQKKPKDKEEDKENQRQASEKMKQAAEETGKVDKDQRKTATQKKVAGQMDDLREAMRRAKKRGSKGAQNPFGKNGKQSDFDKRARGGKGNKGAWGKGKGKGQGKENGGDGTGDPQETNTWGTGHDDNIEGDATAKSGNDTDEDLSGTHGKGPSRKQTILSAAQKGFASKAYQKVYADYKKIVEEVMRSEKVPSSYKYYIKKYFTKIKPHSMD